MIHDIKPHFVPKKPKKLPNDPKVSKKEKKQPERFIFSNKKVLLPAFSRPPNFEHKK